MSSLHGLNLIFLCLLIFTLSSCSRKQNIPQLEKPLSQALIYRDSSSLSLIESLPVTPFQLDSILRNVRNNSSKQSTVAFRDKSGNWTLGIDTSTIKDTQKKSPLIIYLHGGIGTQRTDKGKEAYTMMQFLNDSNNSPFILASPSANREAPWWSPQGIERILFTARYLYTHYNVDPERIYLAGVSDGGTGVFAIANLDSHPFSGFISISGFGGMLPQLGVTLHTQNLKSVPIHMINAGKDRLYPLSYVQQFATYLEGQKIPLTTSYYPNEEHGFKYKEKEREKILQFLSNNRRNDASNYLYYGLLEKE